MTLTEISIKLSPQKITQSFGQPGIWQVVAFLRNLDVGFPLLCQGFCQYWHFSFNNLLLRHLKKDKVFICIWFSASFLYNAVHAVTWASCYDINHIKECQTPAFLQGFIIRFYYKSPTLQTLNLVIHVLFNDSFFLRFSTSKKPPKKQIKKVWRGNVGFNKSSWCIIYCSPGGKMKNKNQKNIPSYITCTFAAMHTNTFSCRTQSKFQRFTCKLLWKVPTVGDECFYKTTIMSLHINNSSTRPVRPVLCLWAFFFFCFT